jgi:ribonuclease J
MADSFTVAIHTPVGIVIHTGDFKIDHTPVDGEHFDLQRLAEYGEKGILCLISDSTNAEVPGYTPSERSVYPNLDRVFSQAEGRILVTTFASSVHRLNIILDLAKKQGRTVAVVGRSMLNVIAHARNLGYIKCEDSLFQPLHAIRSLPDNKVLILTTGSQGEPMSALTRIANGEHRKIKIRKGDTVVFSANPIPGNTIAVVNTIDKLMIQGANVIYGRNQGIHVSGHGCQEEHKLMLALTRPKFFLPFHGEHRMLVQHAKIAQSMGIPAENMVIINNGDMVGLTKESIGIIGQVPSGIELVDASRSGVVKDEVLKERQQLAADGVVTIAAAIGWDGKLAADTATHLRGVVSSIDPNLLKKWIGQTIEGVLSDRWSEFSRTLEDGTPEVDWTGLQNQLERDVQRMLRRELQSNPLLVFLMQNPQEPPTVQEQPATTGRRRTRSTAKVAS